MPSYGFSPEGYTAAKGWRPLRKADPMQRGWDVFDLQCKLNYLGATLVADGIFGTMTKSAVLNFQTDSDGAAGVVDGIAGARTQVVLGAAVAAASPLAARVHGQMEKETSLLCGIYTAPYPDGSFDRGPVQENTNYWPDHPAAFDVAAAIPALVKRIKEQHDRYRSWAVPDERAWAAAQGHWNSPAQADRYALGKPVSQDFLNYIAAVTAYV